jgi:hypothetical protein
MSAAAVEVVGHGRNQAEAEGLVDVWTHPGGRAIGTRTGRGQDTQDAVGMMDTGAIPIPGRSDVSSRDKGRHRTGPRM